MNMIDIVIKTYLSNLVRTTRFWNNLHQVFCNKNVFIKFSAHDAFLE
jgi:hypothetical protein